jgi:hypothetical protein
MRSIASPAVVSITRPTRGWTLAQPAGQRQPVLAGHVDIEDGQVGRGAGDQLQMFQGARGPAGAVTPAMRVQVARRPPAWFQARQPRQVAGRARVMPSATLPARLPAAPGPPLLRTSRSREVTGAPSVRNRLAQTERHRAPLGDLRRTPRCGTSRRGRCTGGRSIGTWLAPAVVGGSHGHPGMKSRQCPFQPCCTARNQGYRLLRTSHA